MHPIAFRRKAKGWTQTDLAQQVGVSLTSVQSWEKGNGPRPRNIPRLAEVFGVDGATLLREIEDWRGGEGKEAA